MLGQAGKVVVSSIAPGYQLRSNKSAELTFVEAYACDMVNEGWLSVS